MTQIAAVYTVLFFLIGAWSALTDFRDRKPFAEVTAEAAAICLLSVGNCFWLIGFQPISPTSIWYIAIVAAVSLEVFAVFCDRRRHIASEMATGEDLKELQENVVFADVGTIVLFLPAIIINLLFASSG